MNRRPLISAGLAIGIGMGGFVDGIVLHQILQVHNMLSNRLPTTSLVNVEINMFWDGVFHALVWLMTASGIALLWKAARRRDVSWSGRVLVGSMLAGWGLFNLVEGLINHQWLQFHHVHQNGDHLFWDLVFLGSGLTLLILGASLIGMENPPGMKTDQHG
jgi:uncharacterized membrane protein